jgi:uncharacterized membrane protein
LVVEGGLRMFPLMREIFGILLTRQKSFDFAKEVVSLLYYFGIMRKQNDRFYYVMDMDDYGRL